MDQLTGRRVMKSSRVLITIIALATVVLAACGSRPSVQSGQSGQPSTGPVILHAATYSGPITTAVRYDNSGITLTVPAADAAALATTSWSDAYANCLSGAAICDTTSAPTITLANATVDKAGTAAADGSLIPLVTNALVYVVSWTGVPCAPTGGPPGATPAKELDSCTLLNLVDAKSGDVLYSVESPTP
jgi:hypothetical protein